MASKPVDVFALKLHELQNFECEADSKSVNVWVQIELSIFQTLPS